LAYADFWRILELWNFSFHNLNIGNVGGGKMIAFLTRAALLLVLCTSAGAQTITVGAEDDWAPYSSAVDGKAQGFAVDVVREAFGAVGVTVEFEVLPYARCLAKARAGKLIGCFDAVPNGMIKPHYLWHDHPLFTTHMNVYALTGSPDQGMSAERLEGKTVGVARDYEYGDEFDLNTNIVRKVVDKNEQGFKMLQAGRIQYMAAEQRIADALFRRYPQAFGGKFKVAGTVATPGLYMAFTRNSSDGARYLAKFNQGYTIIRGNGKYKDIEKRWF
jgi:polar amino acid transport system substrate-binding protein